MPIDTPSAIRPTHPTSFLLQAQASKAKIVGLANAAGDTVKAVKQASEFGLHAGGQELAALLMQVTDVNAIGLSIAKGLYLTEGFYWDANDGTRKFADRFAAQMKGKRPTAIQAGVYAVPCIICEQPQLRILRTRRPSSQR